MSFRPRKAVRRAEAEGVKTEMRGSQVDLCRRLDLSRYEVPRERPEDFRTTMIVNLAVLVLLVTFATTAAAGVIDCARMQDATPVLLP